MQENTAATKSVIQVMGPLANSGFHNQVVK